MKNTHTLRVPDLRDLLAAGDAKSIRNFCGEGHPAVAAELISALSGEELWAVLRHADPDLRAEIFIHLDEDFQVEAAGTLRPERSRSTTCSPCRCSMAAAPCCPWARPG